jgi:uncharacterized protein involved in oxidation of intracellular sulfur
LRLGSNDVKTLFIVNDPPYGTERCYNALRLAHALAKKDADSDVVLFLMADAVLSAKAGQKTPEGFYGIERMLNASSRAKDKFFCAGPAMDVRGIAEAELMEGARRSTIDELAAETLAADKVLVF